MDYKKLALSTVAIFVFIFLLDWLVHGYFLTNYYITTPNLWRVDMEDYKFWCIAINVILSFIYSFIFVECKSSNASKTGITLGVLLGVTQFMSYTYMPISLFLASMWLLTGIVKGLGAGIVFSIVNSK